MSLCGSARTQSYRIWERFPSPLPFEPASQTVKSGSFPKYGAMQGSALFCCWFWLHVYIQAAAELPYSLIVHTTTTMNGGGGGVQQQEKWNRMKVQLGPHGAEGALQGWRQSEQENVQGAKLTFTGKCQMFFINSSENVTMNWCLDRESVSIWTFALGMNLEKVVVL